MKGGRGIKDLDDKSKDMEILMVVKPHMSGASRHGRLRQLTLSVSFVEESIGGGWFTSKVTWTPTFRKEQLARKGLSERVQNHNQHRVAGTTLCI